MGGAVSLPWGTSLRLPCLKVLGPFLMSPTFADALKSKLSSKKSLNILKLTLRLASEFLWFDRLVCPVIETGHRFLDIFGAHWLRIGLLEHVALL